MDATVSMLKRGDGAAEYEWVVFDVDARAALAVFPAGKIADAYALADHCNALAEDERRHYNKLNERHIHIIADDEGRGRYPVFRA